MVHSDEVRRRDFLKGVGVAAATSSVVAAQDSHQKSSSVNTRFEPSKVRTTLILNGKRKSFDIDSRTTLLDLLRENEQMTGTKKDVITVLVALALYWLTVSVFCRA